jgi:hypothetical protein
VITAGALHRAADRVGREAGSPFMDQIADAGAQFLNESDIRDEHGTMFSIADPRALGYGIMLGYLVAQEER